MKLETRRKDLLLELPLDTESITRQHNSLDVATLFSQTYNPVYGTIIQTAANCDKAQSGDRAFFQIFTFSAAKERAYGAQNPEEDGYRPNQNFAFIENGRWYLIIPESEIYFFVRQDEIILNEGYTIAAPIYKNTVQDLGGISYNDVRRSPWEKNKAIVIKSSSSDFSLNDKVNTLAYCEITIEEKLNNPILPAEWFIVETKNITSIIMSENTYKATKGRIIVDPIQVSAEIGGLVSTEVNRTRLLEAKVISAADDSDFKNGETVLIARNSGMPIPNTTLVVLEDRDVFAVKN